MEDIRTLFLPLGAFLLLFASTFPTSNGHNITQILSRYPQFSSFRRHLTTTGLAEEIDHHMFITVCVVDNPTMHRFLAKWSPSTTALRHVLSLHVLLYYYDQKNLRHLTSSNTDMVPTLFGTTNHLAFGYPEYVYVSITNNHLRGGKKVINFSTKGNKTNRKKTAAYFVRSVHQVPPGNISVIQISGILSPPRALPGYRAVMTGVMSSLGCKLFAQKLSGSEAEQIYMDNVDIGGLTIFCPPDYAFRKFLPRFEKLSKNDKNALLLYHGLPVYESIYMLRENEGLLNTLATDEPNRFDLIVENGARDEVRLKTKVVTTRIVGILMDDMPLVIYAVDDVLLPKELFKA